LYQPYVAFLPGVGIGVQRNRICLHDPNAFFKMPLARGLQPARSLAYRLYAWAFKRAPAISRRMGMEFSKECLQNFRKAAR